MATRSERKTTASIKVEVATDTYKNRTLQNINPSVTDSNLLDGLEAIAGLQSHTSVAFHRQDTSTINAS